MNHLPFTILAYLLNAAAVTVDKFLLTRKVPDPLIYIFYFSVFSLLVLPLLPFTNMPSTSTWILASISTLFWTTGAYLMFKAFQIGSVTRIVPVIGVVTPLILLIQASFSATITTSQFLSIVVLLSGLILLIIPDLSGKFSKKELTLEILASLFFAISYLFLREAYLRQDFLTVLVYSRLILIPLGLIILLIPNLRARVLTGGGPASPAGRPKLNLLSKTGFIFILGQVAGGSSELLLTFSISLATPALVNSLQGVQFGFLFLCSLVLAKKFPDVYQESLKKAHLIYKISGLALVGIGLYFLTMEVKL